MIDESQLGIRIEFDLSPNIYNFEHSYWIQDYPNIQGRNSYKHWYMEINKKDSVPIEL
jgi:hypothetical protein